MGQLLIDHTKLTPPELLTNYVVAGVVLGALGLYQLLRTGTELGYRAVTGFAGILAKGVREAVARTACWACLPADLQRRPRISSAFFCPARIALYLSPATRTNNL